MKEADARIRRATAFRWTLVPIALSYVVGLLFVANLAFGVSIFFAQGVSAPPASTGMYDSRLPVVAPVDGKQVAQAITEASGGPPTIGLPLPDDSSPTPTQDVAPISSTTTPTYKATTQVSTMSIASLLAMIPTNLSYPPRAKPQRKG
jgi:hypothetical protein